MSRKGISRRGFLGGAAAGAATLVGSGTAAAHGTFSGYPGRYGLLHDTTLCVGCRSCEVACAEVNDLPAPPEGDKVLRKRRRTTDEQFTVVNRYWVAERAEPVYRKQQCMHCNEPCCANVCFVGAFTKTPEGPVLYDPSVCVGCRYCVMACPYYALGYEYDEPLTPRVMRCTMCYDRIKKGELPGCAQACPTGAITFGRRDELLRVARERMRKTPSRYIDHIFGEHEFGGTSWLVLAGTAFHELGLPAQTSTEPLPSLTAGFLSVVPLVLSIYPGLLLGIYSFSKHKEKVARAELVKAVGETSALAAEDAKKKLAAAADKAAKDQEKAVALAVKKALAEAEAQKKKEGAP